MLILLCGCFSATAQEANEVEVFNPHWYVGGQFGAQHTLGEIKASNLISPNFQVYAGYQFTELWGARLALGGWQSKAGIETEKYGDYEYKWNYIAPTLDATFNLTNAIWGFNASRKLDWNVLAGVGLNVAFNNDEAKDVRADLLNKTKVDFLTYYREGTRGRLLGQFGTTLDYKINQRVAVGVEANANFLCDHYNSKKADNSDWYFNALAGVKVTLGKATKKKTVAPVVELVPVHDTVYVEKPVVVHDTVTVEVEKIRRDIFFNIRGSVVSNEEMQKVADIANYLNKYPASKVTITGYADKGTGNPEINKGYALKRADIVAKLLRENYGIAANRIATDSKGDTEQPYEKNELNRVSICVAE